MSTVIDGSAGITTNAGGSVNPSTNVDGLNYSTRAWVTFTVSGTTPTIRASGNVTSVTRTATGLYTIVFTTAMVDQYYCVGIVAQRPTTNNTIIGSIQQANSPTATTLYVAFSEDTGSAQEPSLACIHVIR